MSEPERQRGRHHSLSGKVVPCRRVDKSLALFAGWLLVGAVPAWSQNPPAPAQPTAGPVAPTSLNSLVPPGPPPPMVGAAPPQSTTRPAGGASVSVEALAPPTVAPGQPLPFEIIVRNAWTL